MEQKLDNTKWGKAVKLVIAIVVMVVAFGLGSWVVSLFFK